jgi:hypothetical protein
LYKYCVLIYVNGKMRPVETIPEMWREGEMKENDASSTMIFCKNFCKCHNIAQHNNR